MEVTSADLEQRLIDSGLVYKDSNGNYYVGINGDTEINDIVDQIIYGL